MKQPIVLLVLLFSLIWAIFAIKNGKNEAISKWNDAVENAKPNSFCKPGEDFYPTMVSMPVLQAYIFNPNPPKPRMVIMGQEITDPAYLQFRAVKNGYMVVYEEKILGPCITKE